MNTEHCHDTTDYGSITRPPASSQNDKEKFSPFPRERMVRDIEKRITDLEKILKCLGRDLLVDSSCELQKIE